MVKKHSIIPDFSAKHIEKFWSRVQRADENICWLWQSFRDEDGYGLFFAKKMFRAHRIMYFLYHGIQPADLLVLHECDTPSCVNPHHLFLGTNQDNMIDMANKKRGVAGLNGGTYTKPERVARGERASKHKLTEKQVREIRERYIRGKIRQADLAAEYGVNQTAIGFIVRGKHWKHIL